VILTIVSFRKLALLSFYCALAIPVAAEESEAIDEIQVTAFLFLDANIAIEGDLAIVAKVFTWAAGHTIECNQAGVQRARKNALAAGELSEQPNNASVLASNNTVLFTLRSPMAAWESIRRAYRLRIDSHRQNSTTADSTYIAGQVFRVLVFRNGAVPLVN